MVLTRSQIVKELTRLRDYQAKPAKDPKTGFLIDPATGKVSPTLTINTAVNLAAQEVRKRLCPRADPMRRVYPELDESDLPPLLAEELEELLSRMGYLTGRPLLARIAKIIALAKPPKEKPAKSKVPDGPVPEGNFGWNGKLYPVSNLRYRLIAVLWGKGPVTVEKVLKEVYGVNGEEEEGALKKLQSDTNTWFLSRKPRALPWEIITPITGSLQIRKKPD